jgi:hypothetical protein
MQARITHKIPEGKLLRMELEFDTTQLRTIKICGDFFIHPEETVIEWEKALQKTPVEAKPERIQQKLDSIVEKNNSKLLGINTEIIAKLISEAIRQ